jgi:gliding motility-associated-like protein
VTTTYSVSGDANGCTNTAFVTVSVYTNTAVQITPDNLSVCPGESALLNAIGAVTYLWQPPTGLSSTTGSSVTATPGLTTTYTVTGSDPSGCQGFANATVTVFPNVPVNFLAEPSVGCAPLTIDFTFVPSPLLQDSSWLWSFGDPSSGNSNSSVALDPSHTFVTPDQYYITLTGTTTDGCSVSASDTISVIGSPVADFLVHPEIVSTDNPLVSFIDQSTGANYWSWNFGDPSSGASDSSNALSPDHIYSDAGYYQITLLVQNQTGCSDTAVRYVTVQQALAFFLPNAFTPNGDGVNDHFMPKGIGIKIETFEMWIYDRWGKNLYYTTDIVNGWDGTDQKSGKMQPEGIYTYIILLRDDTNIKHKFAGTISLTR